MKFNLEIESVEAEVKNDSLVLWSKTPLKVLSSAVWNGGLKEANGIINVQVSEECGNDSNDEHWNAEDFLKKKTRELQLPEDKIVGLMTAARMQNVEVSSKKFGKTTLTVFTTAGTSIAVTAGDPADSKPNLFPPKKCGTINIIVIVDGNLTDSCMVDAVKTVTEAKTVALRELDIRSRFSHDVASGTGTDSVAVACTKKGDIIRFAGTFTNIGELIGKAVRETVKGAIYKQEKLVPNRPLAKRLAERGISIESVLSLLCQQQVLRGSPENRQQIEQRIQRVLSDKRVASLVLASLRLDDDLRMGLIPEDGSYVDEALFEAVVQSALKDYLAEGKPVDPLMKFSSENRLGPFTKRVLSAILSKAC